jgi:hypothetical protein
VATYYCDPSGNFATADNGTNNTGSEWLGPYGLQKAFDTVAAGNTLLVKGGSGGTDCNLKRLVLLTVGTDKTGTWAVGDALRNDSGDGDDWTGILCEISATTILTETITGDYDDIAAADGVENTTRTDTVTCSAKECPGIVDDTQNGSLGSRVIYTGTDSSWNARGAQCVIDGGNVAARCLAVAGMDYKTLEYFTLKDATTENIGRTAGDCDRWRIYHCKFDGNSHSTYASNLGYWRFSMIRLCQFLNATNFGTGAGLICKYELCLSKGNGGAGFYLSGSYPELIDCVSAENTGDGVEVRGDYTYIVGCVFNANGGDGADIKSGNEQVTIRCCRFTNNTGYGIRDDSGNTADNEEDWCYFEDNTAGNRLNIAAGANSDSDNADTDEGYVDKANDNYTTRDDASMRNVAVDLAW